MAYTYSKIASVTVGSGGVSNIAFLSIPQNYNDLCLKISNRISGVGAGNVATITFNGNTTGYTRRTIYAGATGAFSNTGTNDPIWVNGNGETASTFANSDLYIPNYAGSGNKSYSVDGVMENNASAKYLGLFAGLWSNSNAINQIVVTSPAGNFLEHSTFTLYGIKAEV